MGRKSIIIIGGGLAGLTAAIHLVRNGVRVTLFEKEKFPHHKVCGEYVSREVLPYLEDLGIRPEKDLGPPGISRLTYSTARGNSLDVSLPLGGLGISRYAFDDMLYRKAVEQGVEILRETVTTARFENDRFRIETQEGNLFFAGLVIGAFGKRSGLDKVLERNFFSKPAPWLAVKSHYTKNDFPEDLVALHNFRGGYCGLSKTETGAVNVCYLATYESFKAHKDPDKFRENVLRKNPFLNNFFAEAKPVFENPLTIAQVSFSRKRPVEGHIIMLGDAAGLLHPLCGNGMAMAIHSARIASEVVLKHLQEKTFDREKLEKEYALRWNGNFRSRLRIGKWLQKILLKDSWAEFSHSIVSGAPFLLPLIIRQTHGRPLE